MTTDHSNDPIWTPQADDPLATASAPWLDGKVALVAGGGLSGPEGGIGFAMAWLFAQSGAKVAVLDRDQAAALRTVAAIKDAGGEVEAFEVDLTDDPSTKKAVDDAYDHFGRLDVVATSIGGGAPKGVFEVSLDEWDSIVDLNLKSGWYLMRHAEKHLTRGGAIVTVSSGAAEGRGPALPYGIAKTGLEKLTVGAATTLAPRGIRANCVRVGMIWGAFAAKGMTQEQRELRRSNVALQTEGNSWDIASAAFFLCTEQARWISGQVLSVDGGGFVIRNTGAAGSK